MLAQFILLVLFNIHLSDFVMLQVKNKPHWRGGKEEEVYKEGSEEEDASEEGTDEERDRGGWIRRRRGSRR